MEPKVRANGSWDEYRLLHVEAIAWLTAEVRKQHDDILAIKIRLGFMAVAFGSASGIITSVITYLLTKSLHT